MTTGAGDSRGEEVGLQEGLSLERNGGVDRGGVDGGGKAGEERE